MRTVPHGKNKPLSRCGIALLLAGLERLRSWPSGVCMHSGMPHGALKGTFPGGQSLTKVAEPYPRPLCRLHPKLIHKSHMLCFQASLLARCDLPARSNVSQMTSLLSKAGQFSADPPLEQRYLHPSGRERKLPAGARSRSPPPQLPRCPVVAGRVVVSTAPGDALWHESCELGVPAADRRDVISDNIKR